MTANFRLRQQIAFEAARLIVGRRETELFRAKLQAARLICHGVVRPADLPSDREVRSELQVLRRASGPELEVLLGESTTTSTMADAGDLVEHDRFRTFRMLLEPLEWIRPNIEAHPEGDLLYHSLQVFQLVREAQPHDDELLLAALLHEVGKAIDRKNHISAALDVLGRLISERTAWLIENHVIGRGVWDQTIGVRARRRLETSEHFDGLMLLCRADNDGRQRGVMVQDIDDALDYIRALSDENGA